MDDEQLIRDMLARLLRRENCIVFEASSADAAVEILQTTCIGIILVDRKMPGRDGDWLMAHVRDHFPATAIILATGEYVPAHISQQPGVAGFLAKPFTVEAVRLAVADATLWHQVTSRRLST